MKPTLRAPDEVLPGSWEHTEVMYRTQDGRILEKVDEQTFREPKTGMLFYRMKS